MRYSPPIRAFRAKMTTLVLSSALLALPVANAQDPAAEQQPPAEIVTIDFGGGSLADYVATILAATDDVNIIAPAIAGEVVVPAIALRRASVEAALNVVGDVIDDSHAVRVRRLSSAGGRPVYTLRVDVRRNHQSTQLANMGPSPSDRRVDVFSLRSLTTRLPSDPTDVELVLSPETILTAIDVGLRAGDDKQKKAEMKYHADSGLLFVSGTGAQLGTVSSVLTMLGSDLERVRRAALSRRPSVQPKNKVVADPDKN